jgi:hypothetical protein
LTRRTVSATTVEPSQRRSAIIFTVGQHSASFGPLAIHVTCTTRSEMDRSVTISRPAWVRFYGLHYLEGVTLDAAGNAYVADTSTAGC